MTKDGFYFLFRDDLSYNQGDNRSFYAVFASLDLNANQPIGRYAKLKSIKSNQTGALIMSTATTPPTKNK